MGSGYEVVRHGGVEYRAAFNEHGFVWGEVPAVLGGTKAVGYGHPCRDGLGGGRVRVHAIVPDSSGPGWMVEVADNDGRVLPDYRHPTQVRAY